MSKRIKNLLIAGSVILVLAVAMVVLLTLPQAEEPGDTTDADEAIVLLEKGEDITVSSVDVTYDGEAFRLYVDEDGQWAIEGYEDLPVDASAIDTLTGYFLTLEADKLVVESTDSPEDFGLDTPSATYTVTYQDGSTFSFEVGNMEPGGDGYYFRQQDDENIYLIGTYKAGLFRSDVRTYVNKTLVTTPTINEGDENGASIIIQAELSGSVRDQAITLHSITEETADEFPYYGYYISSPYRVGISTDSELETIIGELRTVDALHAEILHPTAEQIQACGLSDPYSQLSIDLAIETYTEDKNGNKTYSTYNPQSYTVRFGNQDENGYYYAMLDGVNAIYAVTADAVPWIAYQYDDIASNVLFMLDIVDIASVSITYDEQPHTFELTHLDNVAEGEETMKVALDGQSLDVTQFRRLYQVLMNMPRVGSATKPDKEPAVIIELVNTAGESVVRANLYKDSANTYACEQLNGEVYAVAASTVENLIEQTDRYLSGKTVSVN